MSADPHRRGLLGLIAGAPIAAAASGGSPGHGRILGRLRAGVTRDFSQERYAGLGRLADELGRADLELDSEPLARLTAAIDPEAGASARAALADVRAIQKGGEAEIIRARAAAALATAFPSEIATYRSFGAPLRRRLYAELLTRESERLTTAGEPPPTPPASPGPDA